MNPNVNANPAVDPQGSTPVPPFNPPSPPLQRGKACLSCRRRKMKCDGARPICTPCLRGERAEDCEYTDGQHRPRTLTLEEDVARLRARVWELENPGEAMPPVELYAPYVGAGATSAVASARQAQSQVQAPSLASHHHTDGTQSHGPLNSGTAEPRQLDFGAEVQVDVQHALSAIAPYAAELGFFLDLDRLRVQGTHILPALQSALALWSVHIASTSEPDQAQASERTAALRSKLLSQAQAQHASALSTVDAEPDPAIFLHVIQTGVLLAYYMQRIGQVVGAKYYASGTWALGTLLKLHQNPYLPMGGTREGQSQALRGGGAGEGSMHGNTNPCAFAFVGCTKLPPALDGIEAEERVRAFWTVYALDRWFCAIGQGPCQSLTMDGSTGHVLTVPWPGVGGTNEARSDMVQHFLNDPSHDFTQAGPSAMYAKASVLLSEATTIAASFLADNAICQSPGFRARFKTLDALLQRCLNAVMTMTTASHGRQSQMQGQPGQGQALVTLHLVALAHVTLHRPFVSTYRPSQRRCVEGAMGAVRVLDQIGELGVGAGICPTYPIVWTALCLALHDEVLRLRARPDADPSRRREEGEMISAIRKLVRMLSALSQHCPSRFFAGKIEAVLPILESIAV